MIRTVKFFLPAEAIIGHHKNSKDSLEILQLSGETPAATRQRWDIMAQISIDTLYGKGVIFVVDIEDMLSWKDHIQDTGQSQILCKVISGANRAKFIYGGSRLVQLPPY